MTMFIREALWVCHVHEKCYTNKVALPCLAWSAPTSAFARFHSCPDLHQPPLLPHTPTPTPESIPAPIYSCLRCMNVEHFVKALKKELYKLIDRLNSLIDFTVYQGACHQIRPGYITDKWYTCVCNILWNLAINRILINIYLHPSHHFSRV